MFLFQKKEEKTNYWKIVGITLGIIAAVAAAGAVIYALFKKNSYCCDDCCDCDCCDCDDYCLDDELCDEIEIEEVEEEEAADAE